MGSSANYDHQKVIVSGLAFANIIHEATKSTNDTEGLLFGDVSRSTRGKITDSDSRGNQQELQFALREIRPFDNCCSFYNHLGQITQKEDGQYGKTNLVGWYKVRRNTSGRVSLRERAVIKNLIKKYNMNDGLIFLLFTPLIQENRSTYSFPYKCYFCMNNETIPSGISLNVINLGNSGSHSEYRFKSALIENAGSSSSGGSSSSTTALPQILAAFENSFFQRDGSAYEVSHIHEIYKETMAATKMFHKSICETEEEIQTCKNEIAELRKKIKGKEREKDSVMSDEREHSNEEQSKRIDHDNDIKTAVSVDCENSPPLNISSEEF